jgi:hypothetical protein
LLIITLVTNSYYIVDSADSPVEKLSDPKIKELLLGSDGKVKFMFELIFLIYSHISAASTPYILW